MVLSRGTHAAEFIVIAFKSFSMQAVLHRV